MIQIAISVAIVALICVLNISVVNLLRTLRRQRVSHAKEIAGILQDQANLHTYLLNNVDRKLSKQEAEITTLRNAAQRRGANGQYIKK